MRVGLAVATILVLAAGGIAVVWATRDEPPPEVLPNSLVRIDPDTLEPTDVFPISTEPDQVIDSGGYLWVMHHVLRDTESGEVRNAGDHTITRVDPSTGDTEVLGGGIAPCGLTSDPSGDVWVANCFTSGSGPTANVVRVDARSLEFEATWSVPGGDGFVRGLAYGGGSLWVSAVFGGDTSPASPNRVLQVDPRTGARRSFSVKDTATGFGWSDGYGDLWINSFPDGSLTRLHPATEEVENVEDVAVNPVYPVVDRDTVWTGDWSGPRVVRIPAVGSAKPRAVDLPVEPPAGVNSAVWDVAVGAGAVWAVTPRFGSLWKIDPETDAVTRIPMPHLPSGVAASDDAVWVTVRGE